MTARTYRSAAYLVALILTAVVVLLFASSRASAASGGGIAWATTTTSSTTSTESSSTSTTESTTSTTETTQTTSTESTSQTTSTSTTTSETSTTSTVPPQTHPPVTPPPTSTDAAGTTTDNGSVPLGRFLVFFGVVGLFCLVLYLLLSIRDAEQVHPYKKWEEYQAAANRTAADDTTKSYGAYFEVDTHGVEIKGPITLDGQPSRGTET